MSDDGEEVPVTAVISEEDLGSLSYEVHVEGVGIADSIYNVTPGDYVKLQAFCDENNEFLGWYDKQDNLITKELVYGFSAKESGEFTAKFTDVFVEADSVSVSESKVVLEVGEVYFNEATILPENATIKSCSYTSSNPEVVRVDVFGMITAVSNGEAEITVTTNDGKAATKYIVTVKGGEESENPEGDTKDETSGSDDEDNTDSGSSETGDNSGGNPEEGTGENDNAGDTESGDSDNPDENNEGTDGGDNSGSNSEETGGNDNTGGNTGDVNTDETESDESDSDTEKETEATEGESVSGNETKSISVSFEANGGILDSDIAAKQVHIGESYGTLPTVSRENYRFLGWYTDKAEGEKIEASTQVTCSENHILYARWEIITYTVTFDAMGGNADKKTITVDAGKTYGKLPDAARNGYVFSGWYTEPEKGICISETSKVTIKSDQTLYAKWEYIEIAVKQKYDISGFFEDVTDMKGYMILEGKEKASISKKGILTAKKAGEVIIMPYKVEGRKKVLVDGIEPLHLILKKPYISGKLMLTSPNQAEDLNTYLADLPGNNNDIKWTMRSSKNPIVTLSGENANLISPVRNGRVRVTAEITNDQNYVLKVPMTVTVKMPKQVRKKVSVSVGKTKKLKFTSLTGQTILWESKNSEIATVDSDGKVYGISKGETVVAATIDDTIYELCIFVK